MHVVSEDGSGEKCVVFRFVSVSIVFTLALVLVDGYRHAMRNIALAYEDGKERLHSMIRLVVIHWIDCRLLFCSSTETAPL